MISLWRVIKFAFQDMGRNIGLSFMTVFILTLMLIAVNLLWSVKVLTREAVSLVKDQVTINVFLKNTAKDKELDELFSFVKSLPEVVESQVITPAEVLEQFKNRHRTSPEILDALKELEANPFGPTIVLKLRDPGDYKTLTNRLQIAEYQKIIEDKSFEGNEQAVDRLTIIMNRVENVVVGLVAVFAAISFMVIFNTIRVAIYTQRTEINIKRLVGAHNWFIRGPYVVEALIFTIVSLGLAGLCMYPVFTRFDPYITALFPAQFSLTNYYQSHILYLSLVQGVAVLSLTILTSWLAMRKHLRV